MLTEGCTIRRTSKKTLLRDSASLQGFAAKTISYIHEQCPLLHRKAGFRHTHTYMCVCVCVYIYSWTPRSVSFKLLQISCTQRGPRSYKERTLRVASFEMLPLPAFLHDTLLPYCLHRTNRSTVVRCKSTSHARIKSILRWKRMI